MKYTQHPLGALLPPLTAAEFTDLKADLEAHGQQRPIQMYDGKVLDGWHRYRALCELGHEGRVQLRVWQGDPINLIRADAMRRALTQSARALLFVELNTEETRRQYIAAKERQRAHAHTAPGHRKSLAATVAPSDEGRTAERLASQAHVSPRTMAAAMTVHEHGTTEDKRRVLMGEAGVESMAEKITHPAQGLGAQELAKQIAQKIGNRSAADKQPSEQEEKPANLHVFAKGLLDRLGRKDFGRLVAIMVDMVGSDY